MSAEVDYTYQLADRFTRKPGRLYLTGWDALARLPLMQRWRDESAGLNTAGFVSGYPGSPLGGLDSLLREQRSLLSRNHVHFQPGLNEDLAATAISGSQYLSSGPVVSKYDGVFGMWYGKGPGVERSTDAMRTASYRGVAPNGGVLALAGDDHDARSTITAQQTDTLFVHMHMPVLNPATLQEYLDYGLAGWALSRFAGTWVGFICLNDTVDSAATVEVDPMRPIIVIPEDVPRPLPLGAPRPGAEGLGGAVGIEQEIRTLRADAARAFVRANGLDRTTLPAARRGKGTLGIITSGKAHLDVRDALTRLNISDEQAQQLGISVYKLAMTWPLDGDGVLEFVDGLDEVLVVEPKYPIIEDQVNRLLWRLPADRRPRLVGKLDENGRPLVPEYGALNAPIVSRVLLRVLESLVDRPEIIRSIRPRETLSLLSVDVIDRADVAPDEPVRAAGFCSGCPHNTSTKVPDGTFAIGGTGCHGMAAALNVPGRRTVMSTHMGGEGALWLGMAPFTDQSHTFQNMGDGTYSHSGYLALRAAIAADVTMTFKILLNGYISMTGGQSIPGGLVAQDLAAQVVAEGARRVDVVTDDVSKYRHGRRFPRGVRVHDREELLSVEESLRQVEGVSVLIYDQACAAELRRERKRGNAEDPDKRVFINPAVCEGCGDCNVQSNCISVEPLETDLGRKRQINQSSCNKDFSCVSGYCPSFVTLYGATPRKRSKMAITDSDRDLLASIPAPQIADSHQPFNIVVGGIGGGGVLTIGGILGMAAHLEGKSASVLNESGLAQKNGAVHSHIRIASGADAELSPRIADESCDLVIGADILVTAAPGPISTMRNGRTWGVINNDVSPTVSFAGNGNLNLSAIGPMRRIRGAIGDRVEFIDASRIATAIMGDAIYMNLMLLGHAVQSGQVPVSVDAINRAIELNGVAVEANKEALAWGRLACHDLDAVLRLSGLTSPQTQPDDESLADLISRRRAFLAAYQDEHYAERYEHAVQRVAQAEKSTIGSEDLARAVANNLFKLMAYKDEYEVARLYLDASFQQQLANTFEGDYKYRVNLAPQIFNRRDKETGRAKKWEIPAGVVLPVFRVLAGSRRIRGTRLDPFGMTRHRRAERARIADYLQLLDELTESLTPVNHSTAIQLASLPELIRGYDMIKDSSAAEAKEKEALLIEAFRS